jgi:hypothetical protein
LIALFSRDSRRENIFMADLIVLDRSVLNWVADDFESPYTILANVEKELGQPIGEAKVRASLLRLSESGDVRAYSFNEVTQHFDLVPIDRVPELTEPWFKASGKQP